MILVHLRLFHIIILFRGGKYKLELQGEGMSSSQFKILTDRIVAACSTK